MTPLTDQTLHQFFNLTGPYYHCWPYYHISRGFHGTLQRVRLANTGRLLLRTPSPVPFRTCIVLMLRPFFPELVMSTDLSSFEHPSVLLFCLYLRRWYIFTIQTNLQISLWLRRSPWPLMTVWQSLWNKKVTVILQVAWLWHWAHYKLWVQIPLCHRRV